MYNNIIIVPYKNKIIDNTSYDVTYQINKIFINKNIILLYNSIKNKNNNINLKIVFIGHRDDDDNLHAYYKKIDDNTFLFTCGYKFRLEDNYQIIYKNIIDFVLKYGFMTNNLIIDLNLFVYANSDNILYCNDNNFYYLDNYYDIIPINMLNNVQIISDDDFYKLYPEFNIDLFKIYNKDFYLFD